MLEPWKQAGVIAQSELIVGSYRHWLGEGLIPQGLSPEETARQLFVAPFVVVSHTPGRDPVLNYGNQMALELWEMTWNSFIQTPSRLTAEILDRPERAELLRKVAVQGYSRDYRGIRITSKGRRFRMEDAIIWNLVDKTGEYRGQAATFGRWTWL